MITAMSSASGSDSLCETTFAHTRSDSSTSTPRSFFTNTLRCETRRQAGVWFEQRKAAEAHTHSGGKGFASSVPILVMGTTRTPFAVK